MYIKISSITDAGYLAGFISGEGTVIQTRNYKNENRQLVITISNTERQILDFTLEVIDACKITRKRTSHTHNFTYAIYNRQVLAVLEQIEPYLHSHKY